MNYSFDTIAAIATPIIPSAIGIIRVSGSNVTRVIEHLFLIKDGIVQERVMNTRYLYANQDKRLDECCFVYYKGPRSFTGEDILEIFTHGSIYVLKEIINKICLINDCRLAKNGEFSQRAFLNGKMPLSKAESIIDIIESNSESSHQIALNQYEGHVYKKIQNLRQQLMTCLEKVEASLEFPDEVGSIQNSNVESSLKTIKNQFETIITTSDYGVIMKKGLTFLIIGKPNVGKSSLLNALSGEERSIVTATPGTTRDYIDITIEYNGTLLSLIDTAGIRETSETIEKIGISYIKKLADTANGYIHVMDIKDTEKTDLPDYINHSKPMINVFNKIDDQNEKVFKNTKSNYYISCKKGLGLDALKKGCLEQFFNQSALEPSEMLSNLRQISELKSANMLIRKCLKNIENKHTLDIVSIDLNEAISSLSNIVGEDFTEELLDGIFANFCIGK